MARLHPAYAITLAEFHRLLDQDGLDGMTSNPTIFEKSIDGSKDYDEQLGQLTRAGADVDEIYEGLTIGRYQDGGRRLRPIYEKSNGVTGYVSYEVSPTLAHDTDGTIAAAHRYFELIDRPNLMIKVPCTPEGLPAIEQLICEGHCINVTLMFSMKHYEAVAQAYIRGLEKRAKAGQPLDRVASVASVFVSRVETLVDKRIDGMLKAASNEALASLRGTAAVANSKLIYQRFKEIFHGDQFKPLAAKGAHVAATLVGLDRHQKPCLQRCQIHPGTDRSGNRQHDAAGHDGRLSRPRRSEGDARYCGRSSPPRG